MKVPGVFWVVLIVILVPSLIPVLQQAFPSATYAWSAIIVVALAAVGKTVEIVYRKQIDKTIGAPLPAATPRPIGAGEYEYVEATQPPQPSSIVHWLVG
jgi:hypothetical protein